MAKKRTSKPAATTPSPTAATRVGVVTSDSRDKTRTVVVEFLTRHPKYGKFLRNRTVLQVHDPENASRRGDLVEVRECRPLSRTKSWVLTRIVEQRSRTRVEALQTSVEAV